MVWPSSLALPISGVFVEVVSGIAGTMVFATGLTAGALRAIAILRGFPAERIEWMTAAGFVVGAILGVLVFALDLVIG